jgi:hypothetical protein
MALSSFCKAAVLGQGGGIARTMQHANNHDLSFVVQIVDGVAAGETYAQAPSKILARGRGKREMPQWLTINFDLVDEACRCRL